MSTCGFQEAGCVEQFFYDEMPGSERLAFQRHLAGCTECRRSLDDLEVIRAALASRPDAHVPPGGSWMPFMARLDESLRSDRKRRATVPNVAPARRPYIAWAAMAALIALVTFSVLFVARGRQGQGLVGSGSPDGLASTPAVEAGPLAASDAAPGASQSADEDDAALLAMSEQHFERSKLVVLGLANADETSGPDWSHERELASSLLPDTRLYRLAAEQRGMTRLARVMGDLELVLLQTSMSTRPDSGTLEQLQRLIRKRDLVTKMELVTTGL